MKSSSVAPPSRPLPGTADGFTPLLEAFRQRLEWEVAAWLAAKRQGAGSTALRELVGALEELMANGGKRLRPALVYHTYIACTGLREPRAKDGTDPEAICLALATEFLHTYLLIHDDIMDHAAVRRGKPSAHVWFRDAHLARGLQGDAEDFGRSAALLLGDLAHSYAVELFTSLPPNLLNTHSGELARCFAAMCEEVIGGQYLEMELAHHGGARASRPAGARDPRQHPDPNGAGGPADPGDHPAAAALAAELTAVLRLKSGRYTAERPIQLGALLAGAPPAVLTLLSGYGWAVGEAFQLQDDLLGMFGDAGAVGKPVGADLREGKFTFLIHHALGAASAAERQVIEAALGNAGATDDEVERVRRLLTATGARAAVEAMVAERLELAHDALTGLDGFPLQASGRLFLGGLLDYLRERER